MHTCTSQIKTQQGMALFVSLIFLLILTILGVSSMQTTVLEEKMAGNFNDQNRSFQASESALRVAESWLRELTAKPAESASPSATQVWKVMNASDNVCSTDDAMWWIHCDEAWWSANAVQPTLGLENVGDDPYYIIEKYDHVKDSLNIGKGKNKSGSFFYRITARATGGSNLTVTETQSFFSRRF